VCIFILILGFGTLLGRAQTAVSTQGFTKPPTEHIINEIDQPFVVGVVQGFITEVQDPHEPLPGVLFEIQAPISDKRIRSAKTDAHGRFKISTCLPEIHIKATLNGFQSVMGTIVVAKHAHKATRIEIHMPIGV
jgi:hypothetical protein